MEEEQEEMDQILLIINNIESDLVSSEMLLDLSSYIYSIIVVV